MKTKSDWIAISAVLAIGFLIHVMLTVDALILPAFIGSLVVQFLVSRTARHS